MKRILFLTKNILAEGEMQNKLQQLNYEVFCTSEYLDNFYEKEDNYMFLTYFHIIILSVSLSDEETKYLLTQLEHSSLLVIRESEMVPSKEDYKMWQKLGIHGWIQKSDCNQVIREKINQATNLGSSSQLSDIQTDNLVRFGKGFKNHSKKPKIVRLSHFEKRIIRELATSENETISRADLCKVLWLDGETSSHLSQLSIQIRRIKKKFSDADYKDEVVITEWGKGYRLSDQFRTYLKELGDNSPILQTK